jgi:hypothetical protein
LFVRKRENSNEGIAATQPECQVLDPWEGIAFATVCSFEIAKISVDATSAERLTFSRLIKIKPRLTAAPERGWSDRAGSLQRLWQHISIALKPDIG